jgi:hypothetical protein
MILIFIMEINYTYLCTNNFSYFRNKYLLCNIIFSLKLHIKKKHLVFRAGGNIQMVYNLPSKHEALNSNHSTTKRPLMFNLTLNSIKHLFHLSLMTCKFPFFLGLQRKKTGRLSPNQMFIVKLP